MSPAFPALLVSVVRLVPFSRVKFVVLMLIWPAFPLSSVEADMATPSDILRLSVWMSIIPALPVPDVSTAMKPSPEMSMVSGAEMNMLPPLPVEEVEAEMKPSLLKVMSRSGLFLYGERVRIPALALASVSANIPSFPVMLSSLVLMVMLPPSPVLVEPITTVALIWASWPISTVWA